MVKDSSTNGSGFGREICRVTNRNDQDDTKSTWKGNHQLDEAMEALIALGYKATELKKIKAFFEGTNETAEQYIKSALKMLMK